MVLTFIYLKIELWRLNIQKLSHEEEVSRYNFHHQAAPLEENLFEWHFTVRGPSDTDFEVCLLDNFSFTIISTTVSLLNISFHKFNHLLFMTGWYLPWPHPRACRLPNETPGHYHTYSKWQVENYLILKLLFTS